MMSRKLQDRISLVRTAQSPTGGWLGRFWAEQDGNMSFLAVAGALTMMVFGGIGIDMMHAELERTKVQNTLDRAVLAAADLNNTLDPELVVSDYLRAMGMADALVDVEVDASVTAKRVSASGYKRMPSNFLGLIGVNNMQAAGNATAINGNARFEFSLVLDVSGSMSGAKLQQLKDGAKAFIDLVLTDDMRDKVTVSIVPYNATVNIGKTYAPYFALENLNDYSHCAIFPDDAFSTAAIDPAQPLEQLSHFDLYSSWSANVGDGWCSSAGQTEMVMHSSDPDALKARIDSLTARGNTAIDLGMKWGAALLDPAMRPAISRMIDDGLVADPGSVLPADYNSDDTQKFVIVMTDGKNTTQYDLKQDIKFAASNVWIDTRNTADMSDDIVSIRVKDSNGEDNDVFYYPHRRSAGKSAAYDNGPFSADAGGPVPQGDTVLARLNATSGEAMTYADANSSWDRDKYGDFAQAALDWLNANGLGNTAIAGLLANFLSSSTATAGETGYFGPVQVTYQDLYGRLNLRNFARNYMWQAYRDGYASYSDYRDAYYAYEAIVTGSQADTRLSSVCAAARQNNVQVYAIGVEAPAEGLAAMADCASSPSHYFDVQGNELAQVFANIAHTTTALRLTQ